MRHNVVSKYCSVWTAVWWPCGDNTSCRGGAPVSDGCWCWWLLVLQLTVSVLLSPASQVSAVSTVSISTIFNNDGNDNTLNRQRNGCSKQSIWLISSGSVYFQLYAIADSFCPWKISLTGPLPQVLTIESKQSWSISINIPDLLELNCRLTRAIDTDNGLSIHN